MKVTYTITLTQTIEVDETRHPTEGYLALDQHEPALTAACADQGWDYQGTEITPEYAPSWVMLGYAQLLYDAQIKKTPEATLALTPQDMEGMIRWEYAMECADSETAQHEVADLYFYGCSQVTLEDVESMWEHHGMTQEDFIN